MAAILNYQRILNAAFHARQLNMSQFATLSDAKGHRQRFLLTLQHIHHPNYVIQLLCDLM